MPLIDTLVLFPHSASIKQGKRWEGREQWENNLSPQNNGHRGPSKMQFAQMLFFSLKLTSHLGFFFTCMRKNGFESVELNWFAAALIQTPEIPIIYPIIARARGKKTFPPRFVDGFHSQVINPKFLLPEGWRDTTVLSSFMQATDTITHEIQQPGLVGERALD